MTSRELRKQATQIVGREMHPLMPRSRRIWLKYVDDTMKDLKEIQQEKQKYKKALLQLTSLVSITIGAVWSLMTFA